MNLRIDNLFLNPTSANGNTLLLKGAPERVIEKCSTYKNEAGNVQTFSKDDKAQLIRAVQNLASQGLRCLALAINYDAGKLANLKNENVRELLSDFSKYNDYETGGTFIGIMGIKDPVRPEVK